MLLHFHVHVFVFELCHVCFKFIWLSDSNRGLKMTRNQCHRFKYLKASESITVLPAQTPMTNAQLC
jgi:hypothetical protein